MECGLLRLTGFAETGDSNVTTQKCFESDLPTGRAVDAEKLFSQLSPKVYQTLKTLEKDLFLINVYGYIRKLTFSQVELLLGQSARCDDVTPTSSSKLGRTRTSRGRAVTM